MSQAAVATVTSPAAWHRPAQATGTSSLPAACSAGWLVVLTADCAPGVLSAPLLPLADRRTLTEPANALAARR